MENEKSTDLTAEEARDKLIEFANGKPCLAEIKAWNFETSLTGKKTIYRIYIEDGINIDGDSFQDCFEKLIGYYMQDQEILFRKF